MIDFEGIVKKEIKEKPCIKLEYCPYGPLVENFPLAATGEMKCEIFGHDCPAYYVAEKVMIEEDMEPI